MNKDLEYLLNTGDIVSKRTLLFEIEDKPVAYVTEYIMNSALGPLTRYCTWRHEDCESDKLARYASLRMYTARARTYLPAFLDSHIPPENRENLDKLLLEWGLKEYNKFDFLVATRGCSPIKYGLVREVEPKDCTYDFIHQIDKIVEEYKRTL